MKKPGAFYNARIQALDEQICEWFARRKELCSGHPDTATEEVIAVWGEKYGIPKALLLTVFQALSMEELYEPKVEPKNFLKHVPVLKSIEVEGRLYTLTFIRQFENASVIHLHVDWNETVELETIHTRVNRSKFKLRAGDKYNCQSDGAGGGTGRVTHRFIVSPALPDDVSGFSFVFEEYNDIWKGETTGLEIVMKIE